MNSISTKFTVFAVCAVVLSFGFLGSSMVAHADSEFETGWFDTYESYTPETGWFDSYESYAPETGWYDTYESYSPETGWYDTYESYSPETGWYDTYESYSPENDYACGCYDYDGDHGYYEDTYYDESCDCYSYGSGSSGHSTGSAGFSMPRFASSGYSAVRPMSFGSPSYPVYTPTYSAPARPVAAGNSSVSNVTNTTITNVDNSINDSFNNYNSNNVAVAPLHYATPQYPAVYAQPTYRPAPYVSLSQIPYTGFDFGPVGNAMYFAGLAIFALGAGYLAVYYLPSLVFAGVGTRNYAPVVPAKAPVLVEKEAAAAQVAPIANQVRQAIRTAGTLDSMAIVASKDGSMPKIVISRE